MKIQLFKKSELQNQESQPAGDQVVGNLQQIIRDSEELLTMLNVNSVVMPWIEDNLSSAKTLLNQVVNAIKTDFKPEKL